MTALRWLAVASLALAAPAQAEGRPRVTVVKSADLAPYAQVTAGFAAEARATVDEVTLEEGAEAAQRAFKKLKDDPPRLILAVGPAAALGARRAFSDVPVIFAMVPYYQKYELEGLNTTGIALTSDLSAELAALKSLAPKVKRVGIVQDPRYSTRLVEDAQKVAKAQGLAVVPLDVDGPARLTKVLGGARGKVDALVIVSDKTVANAAVVERLIAWAVDQKLPCVGLAPVQVKLGALFALAPSPVGIGQQAGRIANRILHEKVDPGALAVAPPDGVELFVNLGTAKALSDVGTFSADALDLAAKRGVALRAFE